MNYKEWSNDYKKDAERVFGVIEKYKDKLKNPSLSKDERSSIRSVIIAYRSIYRELLKTAELLSRRGGEQS